MYAQSLPSLPAIGLKVLARKVDLSAWISGLSFALGLWLAATRETAAHILGGGTGLFILIAAFAAFLALVLLIQRHMRLSLLANSFGSPKRLVTGGIFRCSRNPIYVAFLLPLAAISYFSLSAAIAAIAIYIFAMNLTVIPKEERDLRDAFGADYAAYLARTPRWVF